MNSASESTPRSWTMAGRWLLPLLAVTLLVGALDFWAYRVFSAEIRNEVARTLGGIVEEKRATIEHWLEDIDSDARTFFTGTSVTMLLLENWIAGGRRDAAVLDRLRARLEAVARMRRWGSLILHDDRGEPLMAIGDTVARVPTEQVRDILRRPRIERLKAQPDADGRWHYVLLAPVGAEDRPPLGVVALTWHLDQALSPALAAWPLPIRGAVSALVRREGDTVRFLVSQAVNLAGQQRSFREWPRLFAVQAAQGRRGIVEGALDYRGEPILGYATAIADTPWILIAKIDRQEADAGVRALVESLSLATLLALILIYGAGFELWRWDRRRRAAAALEREQALRHQEQRTRSLLDAILACSTDAIFAKDLEGRYLLANHACAAGLGLTVEQLLGHRDDERLPPAVVATLGEVESRVLAGETFVNVEQRLVLPGGEGVYLTTKAPLRDAEGAIVGLYGIARDISERQRQEAELRAAEATAARLQGELRWKEAIDRVGHGTWEWDIRAGRFERSPTMARLLGLEPTELDADMDGCLRRLHPDDRVVVESRLRAVIAGDRGDYEARYRSLHRDGGWRWFLSRGLVSERGPDGAPWRMIGTLTDITAWQEAEIRLRESEEQVHRQWVELEAIYANAPIGMFVLDREMRFLRINERLAEINGLPVAAHLGRSAREVIPALADVIEPPFQQVLISGEPLAELEVSGETPADPGRRRFWRVYYYPLKDADGQVVGINGVVEEITEIKRVEDEIRALNVDLETKIEARTAEARAASAAKSEFLAHMSHEIRTPLNAVLGLVQVMEQSPLNPEQRDLIARIRAAGRSLLLLLNDILDFSKIEAGQLQLEERPFVLAPLFEQIDSLLGLTARAKGLHFAIDAASLPGGALVGDPLRLEQVLTNLIGNAIKFTDQGEVRLSLRTLDADDSTARLRFAVTDTGIGIAPEVLPQLFAAFNQADSGISRRFGGTGLGLAISKRLVELMGGMIGVESREGAGSNFWFELPFARTAIDPTASVAARPAGTAIQSPRLRGGRYLIVDDNVLNLDVLERMLALEGAQVTRVGDGRAALARLRAGAADFDAVLMDVQMPVLDGLSATRAIRGELGLTELPVIAVTAGVLKEEQQRARAAGVDALLPKPVELDQLVALLSRWAPRAAAGPDALPLPIAPSTSVTTLPVIAGIDQVHIAELIQGDVAFYRQLLSGLVAEARGALEEVRAALARGDAPAAAARLHRLRGVAANVGAAELAAAGQELETALRAARPVSPASLDAFEARVATLLASADPWLAQTEPAPPDLSTASAVDEDAALDPTQLAALRDALASNRPRPARQLFATLQPGLSRRYGPMVVQAIAASLATLDFPAALRALDAALSGTADASD